MSRYAPGLSACAARLLLIAAALCCAAPLRAEDAPATQPAAATQPATTMAATMPEIGDIELPARRPRPRLTAEQEAEVLEFLKQRRPEQYQQLIKMRGEDDAGYHRSLRAVEGFLRRWRNLPEKIRESTLRERDARIRALQMVKQFQQAKDPADQARLRGELRQAVAELFEAEQVIREHRLAELEAQIAELRKELESRRARGAQGLDERVEQLLQSRPPAPAAQPATTQPVTAEPAATQPADGQ